MVTASRTYDFSLQSGPQARAWVHALSCLLKRRSRPPPPANLQYARLGAVLWRSLRLHALDAARRQGVSKFQAFAIGVGRQRGGAFDQ